MLWGFNTGFGQKVLETCQLIKLRVFTVVQ
jgi:hypothetical protein